MGFHRRHIGNDNVISMFESQGIDGVWDMYTRGVDALVTEVGIASQISDIMSDPDWHIFGKIKMKNHIISIISKEIGVNSQQSTK